MRTTTYRMRPDRFIGVFAAGLIVLGAAAIVWAFGGPAPVIAVIVALGGLTVLFGLGVMARPPVLARLDDEGVTVRGTRTTWSEVETAGMVETTQGPTFSLRSTRGDGTVLIPARWLTAAQASRLDDDIRERLNAAHGYQKWGE